MLRTSHRHKPVLFLAWNQTSNRGQEIADALGGEAKTIALPRLSGRHLVPLRYALAGVATLGALARSRPRAVIVMNPPIFPSLIAWCYARLVRANLILDSHAGSFGLKGDEVSRRLLPLHSWLAKRANAVLVASSALAERVEEWGGKPIIVHEAPRAGNAPRANSESARPLVTFVSIFEADEPVAEVVEAARHLPHIDVVITGDLRRRPSSLAEAAAPNVKWSGYLESEHYNELLSRSDAVIALTTEPSSALRAAFEAVYLERPLVVSRNPLLESLFPEAEHVANDAGAIAAGIEAAIAVRSDSRDRLAVARQRQVVAWRRQLHQLEVSLRQTGSRPRLRCLASAKTNQ